MKKVYNTPKLAEYGNIENVVLSNFGGPNLDASVPGAGSFGANTHGLIGVGNYSD